MRDWGSLMARAQDGDRNAYRALLENLTPYLRATAARCFKEPSDAEDAVQDVLLTVHAIRHAYDPGRPFGPWLVAIANRRIIDRLRRQIRTRSREIELSDQHETFSSGAANFHFDDASADFAALHAAIATLAPDQRLAINLLKLKEMSLKEAALASGRSVSALKVAVHRAVKTLRKRLRQTSQTT
jgi:RNA polymerase sigma-70 factor (ECF subfamily)